MEKMRMETENLVDENIKKLMELFPSVVTETVKDGKVERAVDFDALKQELYDVVVEGNEERYQFTWPDKKKARLLANTPVRATLRPCKEESVDFDTTQNLYIEGDNLDVLKLMRETYLGKIKMIYIDPPYNTGNDFVYEDKFAMSVEEYSQIGGNYDEQGNRLIQNLDTNGRFHTDWLNMLYPRLKVARDLLSNDGAIFISIDDRELTNLKKLCDEVFGESRFVAQFMWKRTATAPSLSKNVRKKMEYVLCYCKNYLSSGLNGGLCDGGDVPLLNGGNPWGTLVFKKECVEFKIPDGVYKAGVYDRVRLEEDIEVRDGKSLTDVKLSGNFKWQQRTLDNEISGGTFFRIKSTKFAIRFQRTGDVIRVPSNIISKEECNVGTNEDAQKEIEALFNVNVMDYPKPVSLIKYLINMVSTDDDIVLDFFSGSATTAHAVMQLNAEDGGNRKFIMVQLPEVCGEDSATYRAGYKTICEMGKERIRKASKQIKESAGLMAENLDIGFRVLKLDSSNMKDVYYKPDEASQQRIDDILSNVKEDRTPLDLLFQVMLEKGKPLSSKIDEKVVEGKTVYVVNDNDLICCFDNDIGDNVVKAISQMKPLYAVFRDSSFKSDDTMTNAEQYFRTYSPNTELSII